MYGSLGRRSPAFGSRAHKAKTIIVFYYNTPINSNKDCFALTTAPRTSSIEPLLYVLSLHTAKSDLARRAEIIFPGKGKVFCQYSMITFWRLQFQVHPETWSSTTSRLEFLMTRCLYWSYSRSMKLKSRRLESSRDWNNLFISHYIIFIWTEKRFLRHT